MRRTSLHLQVWVLLSTGGEQSHEGNRFHPVVMPKVRM